jgi:hypothetical protein
MDGNAFLTEDAAFLNLQKYFQEKGKDLNIHQLFVQDPERFKKYRYYFTRPFFFKTIFITQVYSCRRVVNIFYNCCLPTFFEASNLQPRKMVKF